MLLLRRNARRRRLTLLVALVALVILRVLFPVVLPVFRIAFLILVLLIFILLILVLLIPIFVLLVLVLVLIFVLILVVVAASAAVLVLVEQTLCVGVVVFGLHVRGVQTQRLLVAFERLLVLLLFELGVSEVVERFGAFRVRAQRVGRGLLHGLLGAVEPLGLVESVPEVVSRLELSCNGLQGLLVAAYRLLVVALVVLPGAFAHQRTLGHLLGLSPGRCKEKQENV